MWAACEEPRHPVERQRALRSDDHDVAEAPPLEHLRLGEHGDILERGRHRRHLRAGEAQAGTVRNIDRQDSIRLQQRRRLPVKLEARDMGGGPRAAKNVDDDEIGRADQSGRQPTEHRARIAIANADVGAAWQRNLGTHEIDERPLQLDHLLARPGARRVDIAGECESAGAKVYRGDRFTGHPELIDDVTDAGDVLEEELSVVFGADVRLRRPVDDEHVAARNPAIRLDDGEVAALGEDDVWMLGHLSILAAPRLPRHAVPRRVAARTGTAAAQSPPSVHPQAVVGGFPRRETVIMNISTVADVLIAIAVLCWIIYRQFTWQLASPSRLWRMPAILAIVGLIMLAQTKSLANVQPLDLLILVGELVLALGLGAIMGSLAKFRTRAQRASDVSQRGGAPVDFDPSTTVVETRTGALGAALWVVLILVRVGVELLTAHYFPSALLASTGTILLVIAANRAARALVIALKMERSGVLAA
jgi:hypothetical protein